MSLTSKLIAPVTQRALSTIVKDAIRPFAVNVHDLLRTLKSESAIICGDIALDIASINQNVRPLSASILCISVPDRRATYMRTKLMGQGYGRLPLVGHHGVDSEMYTAIGTSGSLCFSTTFFPTTFMPIRHIENARDLAVLPQGCRSFTRLVKTTGSTKHRVNIIESSTEDAAYPVLFAMNTADCNILTAEHLCVAYPRLTNQLKFKMMGWRGLLAVSPKAAMEMRKFQSVTTPKTRDHRLFDEKCMVLPVGEVGALDRSYWKKAGIITE